MLTDFYNIWHTLEVEEEGGEGEEEEENEDQDEDGDEDKDEEEKEKEFIFHKQYNTILSYTNNFKLWRAARKVRDHLCWLPMIM